MAKIVINDSFGGFGLSEMAVRRYEEITKTPLDPGHADHLDRDDPALVAVVEELGEAASGKWANLIVCDVPEGTLYRIDEYDGSESIELKDEIEWQVAK